MHSFFNKFRRSSSANVTQKPHSKSNGHKDNVKDNQLDPTSVVCHNQKPISENRQGSNKAPKPSIPNQSKNQQFSISLQKDKSSYKRKDSRTSSSKQQQQEQEEEVSTAVTNSNAAGKSGDSDLNIFGIIIDPVDAGEPENTDKAGVSFIQIFDPEPAPEEADTTNQITVRIKNSEDSVCFLSLLKNTFFFYFKVYRWS